MMGHMMGRGFHHGHRMCNGIIMLVFGVLFFLNTLGVWPEFTFMKYWPLILIVVALHKLVCKGTCGCEECKK